MFWSGWEQGSATVVARRLLKETRSTHGVSQGQMRRKFEFILDVEAADGSPVFRASCSSWENPVQGDVVPVKYKPESKKVRFVVKRTAMGSKRGKQPKDDRWADMVDDAPGTPPPPRR